MKLRLFIAAALFAVGIAPAADWPQWRGLKRDGIYRETSLIKEWPVEGPKVLWQVKEIGGADSTP